MPKEFSELYKKYCRPNVGGLLTSLRLDNVFHRAQGNTMYYYDENGNEVEVLDFLGGFGSSMLGHNHPDLINIARSNLENSLPFSSQGSCRGKAALLGEKLNQFMLKSTGENYIMTLANTGTEAVEAAIKHAEFYHYKRIEQIHADLKMWTVVLKEKYRSGKIDVPKSFVATVQEKVGNISKGSLGRTLSWIRNNCYRILRKEPVFIGLNRAFHGKTTGSLQLTHNEEYRKPFHRLGIKARFVDPNDFEGLENIIKESTVYYYVPEIDDKNQLYLVEKKYVNVSAIIIEPIQGEGGVHIIPQSSLEYFREVATKNNFPLIFDEIQCGMGRTGTFLFSEQSGVVADYYLLAKSLGGSLSKISALLVKRSLYEEEFGTLHTSTFAEDEHSASIALETLNILEREPTLFSNCIERGRQIKEGLMEIKLEFPGVIEDVRGEGLMLGLQFSPQFENSSKLIRSASMGDILSAVVAGYLFHEHKVRVSPTLSNAATIRIEPSAYITESECNIFINAIRRLSEIIYKSNFYELIRFSIPGETPIVKGDIRNLRGTPEVLNFHTPHRKVAFIGHLIDSQHLELIDDGFRFFSKSQKDRFVDTFYNFLAPHVYEQITVKSLTGDMVDLYFIGVTIDSRIIARHMFENNLEPIKKIVLDALELGIDLGCQVVGFGGFTSIVTNNCTDIISDSVAVTSGNSYTVAMGIEALYKAASKIGIDVSKACLAAVGATGNICSTYCEIMAEKVPNIILISRKGGKLSRLTDIAANIYLDAFKEILVYDSRLMPFEGDVSSRSIYKLQGVAREIYDTRAVKQLIKKYQSIDNIGMWLLEKLSLEMKDKVPVEYTTDYEYIKRASLIVGASNTAEPIIFPDNLHDGPIVINDIAVPADVDPSVEKEKKNVFLIKGGIVKLPYNSDFKVSGIPLDPGHSFACMAETILLGLTGITENFSYGRISKLQVKKILEIARIHGFSLGQFKTGRSY